MPSRLHVMPALRASLVLPLLLLFFPVGSAVIAVNRGISTADRCAVAAENQEKIRGAQSLLNAVYARVQPPGEISSHHAVLLAPSQPLSELGKFSAEVYASLPRRLDGSTFTSSFTKFVVVAHASAAGEPEGVRIGSDVCAPSAAGGAAGAASAFVDEAAAEFFRGEAREHLSHFAPDLVECPGAAGASAGAPSPAACADAAGAGEVVGLEDQLSFLSALLGPQRSLKGKVLPVVMHGQGIRLGTRLGDALALLLAPGGIWEAERVLFVVSADFSRGLPLEEAKYCDEHTAELVSEAGVPQIAEFFDKLSKGVAAEGCAGGRKALPEGYAPVLTAARLAQQLQLLQRRAILKHSQIQRPQDPVNGYAAVLFWDDKRTVWERLGTKGGSLISENSSSASLPSLASKGAAKALLHLGRAVAP